MSTPENKKSELQTMEELNNPLMSVAPQNSVGEGGALEIAKETDAFPVNNEEEKAKWEKEIDLLHRAYEFHLDFALKAVGFFYAILGGILSIYFSGSGKISRDVVIVLLGLPILMSIILGGLFLYGGWVWHDRMRLIREKAKKNNIEIWLKVELVSNALWIFGSLFFIVCGFLIWLITRLDLK